MYNTSGYGSASSETGGSAYSEMGGSIWTDIFNSDILVTYRVTGVRQTKEKSL